GAALDPAGDVRALGAGDAPAVVRDRRAALVERHAGERHAPVADAAEDDAARDRLALLGRDRGDAAGLVGNELVADDLDRLDPAVAEDGNGRDLEAEANRARLAGGLALRVLAQDVDVAARAVAVVLERLLARAVEDE